MARNMSQFEVMRTAKGKKETMLRYGWCENEGEAVYIMREINGNDTLSYRPPLHVAEVFRSQVHRPLLSRLPKSC